MKFCIAKLPEHWPKRIVNYATEGETVVQGTDAGFIKFGSRVDLYLPLNTEISGSIGRHCKRRNSSDRSKRVNMQNDLDTEFKNRLRENL